MTNELIIELPKENALQVFTEHKGIDKYIDKIRQEALSLVPDITTKKGREEIASIAHWVSRSKTYLEKTGKDLCDAERAKIDATLKAVMASRKRIESELDAIRDQVRKPLTDWENAESERKAKIESRIEAMQRLPEIGSNSEAISKHLRRLENTEIDESFGEYTSEAALARTRSIRECKIKLDAAIKIEHDLAELEDLRKKQAEQAQKDREREIAEQAAYKAKQQAEREAQQKIDEANAVAEKQRQIEAIEAKRKIDAANEELEKERAAIRETERLEDLKIAEENKRKSDENHRAKIINQATESLIANDIKDAEKIVALIIENRIKHITINF